VSPSRWWAAGSTAAAAIGVVGDTHPAAADHHAWRRGARAGASWPAGSRGLCLLCHQAPIPEERFQGNLATNLAGAGSRWTPAQLRLRLVDSRRLNADSLMPAFHRIDGLHNVGKAWVGKPVFDAQQVEDVVAWLSTLKD
jgi:sulfur-oxidizing protein SoxX